MNDPFEQQLREQRFRPVPGAWREEILAAVRSAQPSISVGHTSRALPGRSDTGWSSWLWPAPRAWAGLAAAWLLVFGLNWMASGPGALNVPGTVTARPASAPSLWWWEQERLVAELLEWDTPIPAPSTTPPRTYVPRPRSEHRIPWSAA